MPKRAWLSRNALWFVPLCAVFTLIVGFLGWNILAYIEWRQIMETARGTAAYQQSIALLRRSQYVKNTLGSQIREEDVSIHKFLRDGRISKSVSARTHLLLIVSGSKGEAYCWVDSEQQDNREVLTSLSVEFRGDGKNINLIAGAKEIE